MRWRVSPGLVVLALAAFIGAAQARLRPRFVVLTWTKEDEATATFNLRCLKTNRFAVPSYEWPVVTNTTGTSVALPIDRSVGCVWFVVTAVDTNGIESGFGW